jgi:CheY-like chemotaxis protein
MVICSKDLREKNMHGIRKTTIEMRTLLLCADVQFLGITRNVLNRLQVTPKIVGSSDAALTAVQENEFDVIVVDWREIDNLSDFLCGVRRSRINRHCVLVAIVRDLLDLKQSFAAGVHFLIHKPASDLQIERCLRAAYCARVAQRRKQHREPVSIAASVSMRNCALLEATVLNVSEGGVRIRAERWQGSVAAGDELELRFALGPGEQMLNVSGIVVWASADAYGVRFTYIPEQQRSALQQWLGDCVERSMTKLCERIRAACA